MTEQQLAKLLELEEFVRQEKIVANLFKEISNIQQFLRNTSNSILEEKKTLLIEEFSKVQDNFYNLLKEVFQDSKELEEVWSTYVSWFRPWNNKQNNGTPRTIIGEPWKSIIY